MKYVLTLVAVCGLLFSAVSFANEEACADGKEKVNGECPK